MSAQPKSIPRLPLLLLGAAALITGIAAGLSRFWPDANLWSGGFPHGLLMVSGFLGTVIGLERAVALRAAWAYLAPLASGLGGAVLAATGLETTAHVLFLLGSFTLAVAAGVVARKQPAPFTMLMALGALAWMAGSLLTLLGGAVLAAVPFWITFLVFTIAGERLELTRFAPPSPGRELSVGLPPLIASLGLALSLAKPEIGVRIFGLGIALTALWLLFYDIARRNLKAEGLPRYMAECLLIGYVWLLAAGVGMLIFALPYGGPVYDAILHAVFVGFVFSMIFAHAPVILPAVLGVSYPFHPVLYAPLALLHLALLARIGGDLAESERVAALGATGNAAAIGLFLLTSLILVLRARRKS